MITKLIAMISVITLIGLFSSSAVHSQGLSSQSHEEHHEMKMNSKEMNGMYMAGKNGVMDKTEMTKMNKMMKDCMQIHKDEKICDHKMMENCEKKNNNNDCQKMMNTQRLEKK